MKLKTRRIALGIICGTILFGCLSGFAAEKDNYGFGSTTSGIIFSNQTHGGFMLRKAETLAGVEVLGEVKGESSCINIIGLVAVGDSGIQAAKENALAGRNADDIINVEVDTNYFTVLGVYSRTTTILRGIAVKYKK